MSTEILAYVVRPNGETRAVDYAQYALEEAYQPLVSCLMVSRGDVAVLRHSLQCYLDQDYSNRELVVVSDNVTAELERFLQNFPDAGIRLVEASPGIPLGELRNISIAEAKGPLICQWDDDDLHDPRRVSVSVKALLAGKAQAFFLSRWLLWWPARRLIALSTHRPWEGTLVAFKNVIPPYQAIQREEDTAALHAIRRYHPIAVLEMPWLYCYTVTGENTWDDAHFEKMLGQAAVKFEGAEYEQGLSRLSPRVPIREYAAELSRRALGRGATNSKPSYQPEFS